MTDPIVLEEGKIYKVKPPTMNQGALYQLARYAYENDLRFGQVIDYLVIGADLFSIENRELERRIKEFISASKAESSSYERASSPPR